MQTAKTRTARRIFILALAVVMVLSMSVPALAATNIRITHGTRGDGTTPFSFVIPGVISTDRMTAAPAAQWVLPGEPTIANIGGQTVDVYTVPVGTRINLQGGGGFHTRVVHYQNGQLGSFGIVSEPWVNGGGIATWNLSVGNFYPSPRAGYRYAPHTSQAFIQFDAESFYLFSLWSAGSSEFEDEFAGRTVQVQRPVILRVVAAGTQAPATPAPTTPAPATPTAPTPPAANAVLVAGTYRTPGQIRAFQGNHLYTVNHGDTLYELAARFYGNGNLWRELQAANQEWLNETNDGIIFVGFNLLIPAQLSGVRANI